MEALRGEADSYERGTPVGFRMMVYLASESDRTLARTGKASGVKHMHELYTYIQYIDYIQMYIPIQRPIGRGVSICSRDTGQANTGVPRS